MKMEKTELGKNKMKFGKNKSDFIGTYSRADFDMATICHANRFL